jgi:hypothetical protein
MHEDAANGGRIGGTDKRQLAVSVEAVDDRDPSRTVATVVVENAHVSLLRDGVLWPLAGRNSRPAARVHRRVVDALGEVGLRPAGYRDVSIGVGVSTDGSDEFGQAWFEIEATTDADRGERELGDDAGRSVDGGGSS